MSKSYLSGRFAAPTLALSLALALSLPMGAALADEAQSTGGSSATPVASDTNVAGDDTAADQTGGAAGDQASDDQSASDAAGNGAAEDNNVPDAEGGNDGSSSADSGSSSSSAAGGSGSAAGTDSSADKGAVVNGWGTDAAGVRHWYDEGVMAADKAFYDPGTDAWYWADADGSIATGKDVFIPVSNEDRSQGKWVRFDESSRMVKGEDYRYGGWYYFDQTTGEMAKGFRFVESNGGKWVCYDQVTGKMLHGQAEVSGHWYLFDENTGATQYGFHYLPSDNKWVFYDRTMGWMLYGEQAIDGNWYYLDPCTGAVDYGWSWIPTSNKWVYYDTTTGIMLHEWQHIDGVWTYLDKYTGECRFKSDILHYAYEQIKDMHSDTQYLITIDSPACHVCVFEGSAGNWVPIYDWLCSPGKASTPTVTGEYTVGTKGYSFGSGFTCYYWTQIYGDYLFHTIVYYEGTWTPMEGVMGVAASHGCVRLEDNNAYWIYTTVPTGTKIYSY